LQVKNNASFHGVMLSDGTLTFGTGSSVDFANAAITGFGSGGFTMAGDIDMDGYDVLNLNDVDVQGDVFDSTGSLSLDDDTIVDGTLIVYDASTINGMLYTENIRPILDNQYDLGSLAYRFQDGYFSSSVNIGSTLILQDSGISDSNGSVNINGNLVVNGTSLHNDNEDYRTYLFNGGGNYGGNLAVNDGFVVTGVSDFQNSLWNSTGSFTVSDTMTVDNIAYLNGGINVNAGQFTVDFTGNVLVTGYLNVRGDLSDDLGPLTINDTLVQSGSGNQVTFNGNVDALNGLDVTGPANVTTDFYVGGNSTFAGAMDLQGNVYDSTGNLSFGDDVIISGIAIVNGVSTTINGNLYTQNILPSTDNMYNIGGSSAQRYFNGYFGDGIYVGDTSGVYSYFYNQGMTTYNQNLFLSATGSGSVTINPAGAVYLNPVGNVSYSRHFYPDNSGGPYDLGAAGNKWRDLYLSGTLKADGGVDTGAAGTPLMLGGSTANLVYLDAIATLSVGVNTTTVNIDAITTLNIGTSNAVNINIGNAGSTTNLAGSFTGAGPGSGLNADMVDGKHMAEFKIDNGMFPVLSDATYTAAGFPNIVMCSVPVSGLSSLSSVVATPEHNSMLAVPPWRSFPLSAMVFTSSDTPGNACSAGGPPAAGTFHAIVYIPVMMGALPPAVPGSIVLNVHASQ